jgi:hypothetical protein
VFQRHLKRAMGLGAIDDYGVKVEGRLIGIIESYRV